MPLYCLKSSLYTREQTIILYVRIKMPLYCLKSSAAIGTLVRLLILPDRKRKALRTQSAED